MTCPACPPRMGRLKPDVKANSLLASPPEPFLSLGCQPVPLSAASWLVGNGPFQKPRFHGRPKVSLPEVLFVPDAYCLLHLPLRGWRGARRQDLGDFGGDFGDDFGGRFRSRPPQIRGPAGASRLPNRPAPPRPGPGWRSHDTSSCSARSARSTSRTCSSCTLRPRSIIACSRPASQRAAAGLPFKRAPSGAAR